METLDEWITIEDFPKYEITKNGRVRNKETQHIKTPSPGKRGYPVVSLWKDGKQYLRTIHILLARTFIPNPENKPQVNHIDGNKENYDLGNLEWVSARENVLHAKRTGLQKSDGDKVVRQYTKTGDLVCTYKSASEAARENGYTRSAICNAARGLFKYYKGYIWRYVNADA